MNSLSGAHDADKIYVEQNLTLQAGGWLLGAEGRVQPAREHGVVGPILPLRHFHSYVGRLDTHSLDQRRYQRYRCMVCDRQPKLFLASPRVELLSAHHRLETRQN